jgi:hypothetical protein
MSHTPAPWTVSELYAGGQVSEYHIFIEPGVAVIERKVEGKDQCDMADARLIAAAPDLLEALKAVVSAWETGKPYVNEMGAARAAIARATGEAS